ncbi:MAG TPA: hypothetical protein VJT50_16740 [Pyrinomonadaceae bacterium]|nr:hypothetical protein [Pyrinomonadaceae bacterium]
MDQTNHFFNIGYGWLCKHCSAEDAEQKRRGREQSSDAVLALASWADESHQALMCRRCGIVETVRGPNA